MQHTETIVVSVGGSLIVPDHIDTTFLKKLRTYIYKEIELGKRFVIITGGGKTCRKYQDAASKVCSLENEDLDWLGIHATRLNGHLLRSIFRDIAHPVLIKNPNKKVTTDKPVIIAAGWKPGWSTDYVAVQIAKKIGAKKLVNLSNIDYAYDKDPNKHSDAKLIKEIDWEAFRTLLPETWDPGLSSPFDPIAAKDAQKHNLEVAIINGAKLGQMEKYLNNEKFKGTLIS
jgi:uridylate kinase